MVDILHVLTIHATPQRVYDALTTEAGLQQWWAREAAFNPRVGGTGIFRFNEGRPQTVVRVEELVSPARVVLKALSSNEPGGWSGTTIVFDLRADGNATVVSLAHRGFKAANEDYAVANTSWAYYLVSLQRYLETGESIAQQEKDFPGIFAEDARRTTDIVLSVDIATKPERAYEALSTERGLAGWYTPRTKAQARVGTLNEFTFGNLGTFSFRVEELVPLRRVCWSGVDVPDDWKGSRVSFDIVPDGEYVTIRFAHTGLPRGYEDAPMFNYLWAQLLRSIKRLLEKGEGEPYGSPGSLEAGTCSTPPVQAE